MESVRDKQKPRKDGAMIVVVEGKGVVQEKEDMLLSPKVVDAASKVLGNKDLLKEILVRLGLSIPLVRSALVCKHWLHVVANPKFLGEFGKLHPRYLLASYIFTASGRHALVPHQGLPTEFASILSSAKRYFSDLEKKWCGDDFDILDWCCGQVLISVENSTTKFQQRLAICTPLNPTKDFTFIPQYRPVVPQGYTNIDMYDFLSFKNGSWCDSCTSAAIDLPSRWLQRKNSGLLIGNKFYMLGPSRYILGLDLLSMSLFIVDLPNRMEHNDQEKLQLSRAEDSKLYLIHLNGLQLHVWFHVIDNNNNNNNNTGNWVLIDKVCLLEVFGHIANPGWKLEVNVKIVRGGSSVDFVYLDMGDDVYLVHIKRRVVKKVSDNGKIVRSYPFMMAWPPTFPSLIM
uniref:F-box protein AT5G49610-like beta-propeller domain-containing protein n=1 Tax=Oryza brachyantha TaxID=4533 RepID=J3LWY0_ORYBR